MYWPLYNFQTLFARFRPKTDEDFKAFVWMFGGSKPSDTEKVEMKVTDDGKTVVLIITPKTHQAENGILPLEASNRESAVGTEHNEGE